MKLLGWMHRKLRQNNSAEPFKDLVIGNSCNCLSGQPSLDEEQNYHQKQNLGIRFSKQTQKTHNNNFRKSFASLESTKEQDEEEYDETESQQDHMFDLFPGFLAIGTLGSDQQIYSYPSTPTFPISVESITEKEDEVTENDLKLINDELEKVLGNETKDEVISYDSSRRNSHVSTGRSSHVSIVTISGKQTIEGTTTESLSNAVCPLQGYLFGTAVEFSETAANVNNVGNKKENRTSLGELFQRSKLVEENFGMKFEKDHEKRNEKDGDKYSAMNLMKEKLKKKMFHSCSKNSGSIHGGNDVDSASAETKLNKILHMFRKKVHPENSTTGHKSAKHRKNENKKKIINDGGCNKGYLVHPEEDSSSYREHWIKTDVDYLVLEL